MRDGEVRSAGLSDATRQQMARIGAPLAADQSRDALQRFATAVRDYAGADVEAIYLFGSRARGDNRPDSDADIAVVFRDSGPELWQRLRALSDIAFDILIDTGLHIQPLPIRLEDWKSADTNGAVANVKRDGLLL